MSVSKKSDYCLSSWLITKAVSFVYLIAFLSLATQMIGLVGKEGIIPVAPAMNELHSRLGLQGLWQVPTLCWFNASDAFLQFLVWGGAALSILLFLGIAPALTAFLAWIFYLSLTVVGRDFLGFQWDNLLLETGFLVIFLVPLTMRGNFFLSCNPTRTAIWIWRLLLFKLMLQSGLVKLLSGDPNWRHLNALTYHYWTQPLPNVISWYADKLPLWFQKISVIGVFIVELLVPFFIFFGRRARTIAFWIFAVFQIIVILTGNYCFFNILTIIIGLSLLDDAYLKKIIGQLIENNVKKAGGWHRWVVIPIAAVILLVSFSQIALWLTHRPLPKPVMALIGHTMPFRTINNYGLFAMMTTQRHEIVIEGSSDGVLWLAYEFHWKPGDVKRVPGWVMPHQPRLDWQMWFAALGNYQENPWVIYLMARLMENSKPVTALLKTNPFPGQPPKYIRAGVYDYHFTNRATLRQDGTWWQRSARGLYCPVLRQE